LRPPRHSALPEAGCRDGRCERARDGRRRLVMAAGSKLEFGFEDLPGPRRDLIGYGRHGPKVFWPDGARVAVSLVVNYEEGSGASHPAGDGGHEHFAEFAYPKDPAVRDLATESIHQYGSRAGV